MNVEIVYIVYAHHSNYIFFKSELYIFFKSELNEAMEFAKKENGCLARIIRLEDGTRYICWYDFKYLCWSD